MRRSIHQGFCFPDLTDITVICDAVDETLFCKILSDHNHLLAPLLPNEVCTPYNLRPRRHNRQLTPKVNKLCDSNFMKRKLYKDSYWLSCILSAFYFTCWAAFCQLIINEYCIVLYCNSLYHEQLSFGDCWLSTIFGERQYDSNFGEISYIRPFWTMTLSRIDR